MTMSFSSGLSTKKGREHNMTTKHTPGPWDYIVAKKLIHVETANKGDGSPCGVAICSVPLSDEANASLIAAAPDLLSAAIEVLAIFERESGKTEGGTQGRLRAAIAKAEGRE